MNPIVSRLGAAILASGLIGGSAAANVAVVDLFGGAFFIQEGQLTNNPASTANITSFTYSLGTPGDGIATWEISLEGPAGFTRSDFLSDADHYQTFSYAGLNIAPGGAFNFTGLDIDLITSLVPLVTDGGTLDENGDAIDSLRNAFVHITWSDGTSDTKPLQRIAWRDDQHLTLASDGGTVTTPEPATLAVFGVGLAGLGLLRRR